MVAFATASAAASNTASAEWTYLLVILCLVVADICGESGEAMAQHLWRNVRRTRRIDTGEQADR